MTTCWQRCCRMRGLNSCWCDLSQSGQAFAGNRGPILNPVSLQLRVCKEHIGKGGVPLNELMCKHALVTLFPFLGIRLISLKISVIPAPSAASSVFCFFGFFFSSGFRTSGAGGGRGSSTARSGRRRGALHVLGTYLESVFPVVFVHSLSVWQPKGSQEMAVKEN